MFYNEKIKHFLHTFKFFCCEIMFSSEIKYLRKVMIRGATLKPPSLYNLENYCINRNHIIHVRAVPYGVVPRHAVQCRAVSYVLYRALSCRVVPCYAVSCGAVLCRVLWCRAMPCRVVPCHAVSCRALSCRCTILVQLTTSFYCFIFSQRRMCF